MKKTTNIFSLFFLFFFSFGRSLNAESQVDCPGGPDSNLVLENKVSKNLEKIYSVIQDSCKSDEFLKSGPHNRLRCDEVALCLSEKQPKEASAEASKILKTLVPNAAMMAILEKEMGNGIHYNPVANRLEACPTEKVNEDCSQKIQQILAQVGKDYFQEAAKSKFKSSKQLKTACNGRVTLNKICQQTEERIKSIDKCEKKEPFGCLDKEQKALAVLVSNYNNEGSLFLALEGQLCTGPRMTEGKALPMPVSLTLNSTLSSRLLGNRQQGFALVGSSRTGLRMPSGNPPASKDELGSGLLLSKAEKENLYTLSDPSSTSSPVDEISTGPKEADVRHVEDMPINTFKPDHGPEVISGFKQDDASLSDQFSSSMNEFVANDTKENSNTPSNASTWNSDFNNRFNTIAEEERLRKEEEEEDRRIKTQELSRNDTEGSTSEDKKKKEELSALVSQINSLKAKIEEMNASVDELKTKKEAVAGTEKSDKEAQEREKAILDMKKKLAELESDKKKMQANNQVLADAERERVREETRKAARPASMTSYSKQESEKTENVKRDRENVSQGQYSSSAASFQESSRAPASVSGANSSLNSASTLVLKTGRDSSSESAVIYMTAVELQKYPYHLNNDASNGDIEKMILGNKGATIILGNSEQIIPITENGVVQLDEAGKVKYKRVKISLVKNERERKQSIERDISSVADLKREEQKRRDLIRYQEMKNAIIKATK